MVDLKKLVLVSLAALAFACTGTLEPTNGGDGDGDADGAVANLEKMQFENNVLPLIVSAARDLPACSICHAGAAVPTLFGADGTAALAGAYDALIGGTQLASPAATSLLVTKGPHDGNAFCTGAATPDAYCTVDEVSIVTAWIDAEILAGRVQ